MKLSCLLLLLALFASCAKPSPSSPTSAPLYRGRFIEAIRLPGSGFIAYVVEVDGQEYLLNSQGGVVELKDKQRREAK